MMVRSNRYFPWFLGAIGIVLVAILPVFLDVSRNVVLWLALGGSVILWIGGIWRDSLRRSQRDERVAEIHYRAGYNTSLALVVQLGTLSFVLSTVEVNITTSVILGMLFVAAVVYRGSVEWLKREI